MKLFPREFQDTLSQSGTRSCQAKLRRRYYMALKSGMQFHRGKRLRFLTLTSPPGKESVLQRWKKLLAMINRRKKEFDYILLETAEGNGVLHIIITQHLSVEWLRKKWDLINEMPPDEHVQLDIRYVDDEKKVSRYLVSQYLGGQDQMRSWTCSRKWLWTGYRRDWMDFVHRYGGKEALNRWKVFIELKREEVIRCVT